ncbi:MAG: ABC transporter substrate-binding protein [Chitinispirillaceae bacterium]|nr:ABC transporter substrate-binding protein [Chitinispirillaceae bacterium]
MNRSEIPAPRIISFAPSITETIFALGAQEHLAGVTDFCFWPPEAKRLPKVGGYIDPNFEQIVRLKPDVAILLKEHGALIEFLTKHKVRIVRIDNENISGIFNSISLIGDACGVPDQADSLIKTMSKSLHGRAPYCSRKPRILFCVGRDKPGSGTIGSVFCAGPKSFYSELIDYAGGENAFTDTLFAYPSVAGEGIIHMAPDIIIDAMASNKSMDSESVGGDWNELDMVPAVKIGAVYPLTGTYVSIPGPRITDICKDIRKCIEDWQTRSARGSACLRFK